MTATPDAVDRYLGHLKKALQGADPQEQEEILSDIRSLITEHLESAERSQTTAEAVLNRLGPPEALAEAYRTEGLLSRAAHSSAPQVLLRAALTFAAHGAMGFTTALVVFIGYVTALAFVVVAVLKPVFPNQVGLWVGGGEFTFGVIDGAHASGAREVLGYWALPVGILLGLVTLVLTTLLARWFIRFHIRHFPFKSR